MVYRIGITLGDVTGIGPEVLLKALATTAPREDTHYIILGDPDRLHALNRALGTGLNLTSRPDPGPHDRISVRALPGLTLPESIRAGGPEAANAALAWLREGGRLCLAGQLDALVTAPLSKAAIIRTGQPFVGQTEFLTEMAGNPATTMMLLGHDDHGRWLRVALATTHLPLRRVADALSRDNILTAIRNAARACVDLGLARARVGVCGLNPHAGESGALGHEETTLIGPTIAVARNEGLDVAGPLPADTAFHAACRGDYDAIVAMYHDQGLPPLKLLAFETGVNWTLGLPFVRTSPDHGTAYDIAGLGVANPSSMGAALHLARQLARHRRHPCPPPGAA